MKNNLYKLLLLAIVLFTTGTLQAQNTFPPTGNVGIGTNTPNASSILEVKSTSQGMLTPRMTLTQRNAISSPATGLLIYQTDNSPGFYYYSGTSWTAVYKKAWNNAGNTGTTASMFLGNIDNKSLRIRTYNIERAVFDSLGNVGIGTKTPGALLDVFNASEHTKLTGNAIAFSRNNGPFYIYSENAGGSMDFVTNGRAPADANSNLVLKTDLNSYFNGNIGIGTSTPSSRIEIAAGHDGDGIRLIGSTSGPKDVGLKFSDNTANSAFLGFASASNAWMSGVSAGDIVLGTSAGHVWIGNGTSFPTMLVTSSSVCIGTSTSATGYMLNVGGKIIAEEVRVALQANWPDYVFEKEHQLMPIDQLENQIANDKHLPGMPSACEVEENGGFELGEMQTKTLEKTEENTLYIIQLHKENEQLHKENEQFKAQLNAMQSQIDNLKK